MYISENIADSRDKSKTLNLREDRCAKIQKRSYCDELQET